MSFIADDFVAWLIGALAEAGRRRLVTFVLGEDVVRAVRQAATAAIQLTVEELAPGGGDRATHLAMIISEVFSREPGREVLLGKNATLLEGLQAGIAAQLRR